MGLLDTFKKFLPGQSGGSGKTVIKPAKTRLEPASRFEFTREAFSGTMSNFRRVREVETGRTVGLKILDMEKNEAFEGRFKGLGKPPEGEIGMRIKHPLIVETYEYGLTVNGEKYVVMEYIEGPSLSTIVQNREDAFLSGKRVSLLEQMATAIGVVHRSGFIHRDICPRNFICSPDGNSIRLIDFGLTVPDEAPYRAEGNRTGTPLYMAPEIIRRRPTDRRVDIFALGVTAYRMFTFEHPWPGSDTTGKAALSHDTRPPIPIRELRPTMAPKLAEVIMNCIESDPDKRPASTEPIVAVCRTLSGDGDVA